MVINIVLQKTGTSKENLKTTISNKLIRTEQQAVMVGKQELWNWYYRLKKYSIKTPYRGILDGDVIEVRCSVPNISNKFLVRSVSINGSLKSGVSVVLGIEGEYDDPAI